MTPKQLKGGRERLGLTQEELAKELKLSSGRQVRFYEGGQRRILGPVEVAMKYMLKFGLLK